MRRIVVLLLSAMLIFSCCFSACAEEEWTCPSCGETIKGNFCSNCGEKRPDDGTWICPTCGAECTANFCSNCGTKKTSGAIPDELQNKKNDGKVRLDLDIAFEKNAIFSTYDVKLLIDDELVATMRHGIDYVGTVYVTSGKHVIVFQEDNSLYPSEGSTIINITEPSLYKCEIHAKMDTVQITGERIEIIQDDNAAPGENGVVKIDGDIRLQVSIEFKKNAIFSQYNVDLYVDDIYIATLPHGKNYEGTVLVSKGTHMIMFCKSGNKKIRGTCSFKVDKEACFTCKIESTQNKVEVRNDKLSY